MLANSLEYRLGSYGNSPTFPTPPLTKSDLQMQDQTAPPPQGAA